MVFTRRLLALRGGDARASGAQASAERESNEPSTGRTRPEGRSTSARLAVVAKAGIQRTASWSPRGDAEPRVWNPVGPPLGNVAITRGAVAPDAGWTTMSSKWSPGSVYAMERIDEMSGPLRTTSLPAFEGPRSAQPNSVKRMAHTANPNGTRA
jgi:hypothetical protein